MEPAGELPWSLCRGNIQSNLEALKEDDQPLEPVSAAIWELMHLGYPLAELVVAGKLMAHNPWATLPCEQMHGSLAIFRKRHPDFGVLAHIPRFLMLQFSRVSMPYVSNAKHDLAKVSTLLATNTTL